MEQSIDLAGTKNELT